MVAKQSANTAGSTFETTRITFASNGYPSKGETMRKRVFSAALTCGLLAAVAAATAYAQMPGMTLRTRIPFDFSVRGKTLPAGEYQIRRVYDSPDQLLISRLSTHEHEDAIFNTEPVQTMKAPNKSVIVFHRYGDSYFLSEVLVEGEQTGRELTQTRQERQLRREMASNGSQTEPESVAVAIY